LIKKIVITGPESSGKTTLASLLAKEYDTNLVGEYAREYLEKLERPYELDDVVIMAKEQLSLEQNATSELTILDTDLTVFAIWIKEKYKQEIDWIEEHLKNSKNKIYFLCDTDVEWEEDNLREHPSLADRKKLFENYKNLLEKYQLSYHIISGDLHARLKKCREIIG
jgi:nicotinamide riboside kinase